MKHLVIVPTYQEVASIAATLQQVARHAPDCDVLVVDDASTDGTPAVVQADRRFGREVHLLQRPRKDGLGNAYREGFRWALERRYDAVVQMDADLSHPAETLPDLLSALTEVDVAVGSRYVAGGRVDRWSRSRRILSQGANLYARSVLGLATRDATAGFKALRASAIHEVGALETTSNGYCFQIETIWRAERAGLRVRELPITFEERQEGESKMSAAVAGEAMVRVLRWRAAEVTARLRPGASRRAGTRGHRQTHTTPGGLVIEARFR